MAASDFDGARGVLQLSPAGLAAAVLLLPGPLEHGRLGEAMRHEVADLEHNGLARHGRLAPWVARRLMLLLAPDLHVEAIVASPAGTSVTQIWARPSAAVIGQIDARRGVQLSSTEPRSLAWTVRTIVGLIDRAERPVASRAPIDLARLARFDEAVATGDHRRANELLADGEDHSGQELAVMAALVSPDRRTWRITTRWTSPAGAEHRWLTVLDAGGAGLWCAHRANHDGGTPDSANHDGAAGDVAGGAAVPLLAASVADVWERLVATLPPGTAEAPGASPSNAPAHPGRAPCPPSSPPNPTASCNSSLPPMTSMPA